MYILYNILWILLSLIFFPAFIIYTRITGKKREGLLNFLGIFREEDIARISAKKKIIWVHALSIGEVHAVTPLILRLKKDREDIAIVLSVTTEGGFSAAKKLLPYADIVTYSPFDHPLSIHNAFKRIAPHLLIITETGIWPNLIIQARMRKVSSILIHGRISERSMSRYAMIKGFAKEVFNSFDTICMQNEHGANMLRSLDVSEEKIKIVGDTKFDNLKEPSQEEKSFYSKGFSVESGMQVIIGGSTHEGEEEVLLDIFMELRKRYNLLLVIAPRRVERIPDIERLLNSRGVLFDKWTKIRNSKRVGDVVLLDTTGDLARIYFLGDIIFVGRSLFKPGGGHSLLEPASFGKVILHGQYMEYNKETAELFDKEGIAFPVKDKDDMLTQVEGFLKSTDVLRGIEEKGKRFIEENKGASDRLFDIIKSWEINR